MKQKLILAIVATCMMGLCGEVLAQQVPASNQLRAIQSWLEQNQNRQIENGQTLQQELHPLTARQQETRQQQVQRFQRLTESRTQGSQASDWKTPDWRTQYGNTQDWQFDWLYGSRENSASRENGSTENWAPLYDQRYQQSQVQKNNSNERLLPTQEQRNREGRIVRLQEQTAPVEGQRVLNREQLVEIENSRVVGNQTQPRQIEVRRQDSGCLLEHSTQEQPRFVGGQRVGGEVTTLQQVQQQIPRQIEVTESIERREVVIGATEIQQNVRQLQQAPLQTEVMEGTEGRTIVVGASQVQEETIHFEQTPIQSEVVETIEGRNAVVGSAVVQERAFELQQTPVAESAPAYEPAPAATVNQYHLQQEITGTQELQQTPDDLLWPGKSQIKTEVQQHAVAPGKILKLEDKAAAAAIATTPKARQNAVRRNAGGGATRSRTARTARTATRGSKRAAGWWWMLAPLVLIPFLGWMGWQALRGETEAEKADRLEWENSTKRSNLTGLNLQTERAQQQSNASRVRSAVSEQPVQELKLASESPSEKCDAHEVKVYRSKDECSVELSASKQPAQELEIVSEDCVEVCETESRESEVYNSKTEARNIKTKKPAKQQSKKADRTEWECKTKQDNLRESNLVPGLSASKQPAQELKIVSEDHVEVCKTESCETEAHESKTTNFKKTEVKKTEAKKVETRKTESRSNQKSDFKAATKKKDSVKSTTNLTSKSECRHAETKHEQVALQPREEKSAKKTESCCESTRQQSCETQDQTKAGSDSNSRDKQQHVINSNDKQVVKREQQDLKSSSAKTSNVEKKQSTQWTEAKAEKQSQSSRQNASASRQETRDDFTQIAGCNAKMQQALYSAGYFRFSDLEQAGEGQVKQVFANANIKCSDSETKKLYSQFADRYQSSARSEIAQNNSGCTGCSDSNCGDCNQSNDSNSSNGKNQKSGHDDLTRIHGIGAATAKYLRNEGFGSFRKIFDAGPERLRLLFAKAGPKFKLINPASWSKQASFAMNGDWAGLSCWQTENSELVASAETRTQVQQQDFASMEPDDLTKIRGIGPASQKILFKKGICRFEQIANMSGNQLEELFEEYRDRFQLLNPSAWPKQAAAALKKRSTTSEEIESSLLKEIDSLQLPAFEAPQLVNQTAGRDQ